MKASTLILISVLLLGCSTLKTSRPFENFDFKNHDWQIVYIENQYEPAYTQSIWMLRDNKIIDSLKKEYKCNLKKQCDGELEYQLFSFKDHWHNSWNLFCNKNYFTIGELKSKLVPVNTEYFKCESLHSTKILVDSLNNHQINYTITPTSWIPEKANEYAIVVDLGVNIESKLFQNNDSLFTTWTPNAKKELMRLFPELVIEDFFPNTKKSWDVSTPGFDLSNSNNADFYFKQKPLTFVFSSNSPFTLDLSKLKNTDLFLDYYIHPQYIVTIYSAEDNN